MSGEGRPPLLKCTIGLAVGWMLTGAGNASLRWKYVSLGSAAYVVESNVTPP